MSENLNDAGMNDSTTGSKARRAVTGVAIGLAVLTTGGVAIAATHTGSGSAGGAGGAGGPGGPGGPGGGFGGTAGGFGGTAPGSAGYGSAPGASGYGGVAYTALHGTFVVPGTTKTATVTDDLQRGAVSAISATSITVKSTVGFTKTWVSGSGARIDGGRDTPARINSGDSVLVVATDSTGTALDIQDQALAAATGMGAGQGGTPLTT